MTKIGELPNHLLSISQFEWKKLFDLLSEIEETKIFGVLRGGEKQADGAIISPWYQRSEVVNNFERVAYELGIVVPFDWGSWDEGRAILGEKQPDFEQLDAVTLCKLITAIIRNDRFCEGALVGSFESGVMPKIILSLKNKFVAT
jgi:Family of unknown function (DUF6508)